MSTGITVVICCYNSENRIEETLNSVIAQSVNCPWEILVVDNNSNDSTVRKAKEVYGASLSRVHFRIVRESKPGLIYAREKGIESSLYDYILFVDDDNSLCTDYLSHVYRIFTKNPNYAACGGESRLQIHSGFSLPHWWEENKSSYAVGQQAAFSDQVLPTGVTLWGAGLAIRKEAYIEAKMQGCVAYLTGRKGDELVSGEDKEIGLWFQLMGYELFYSEEMCLNHRIPQDRINASYLEALNIGFGQSAVILNIYKRATQVRYWNKTFEVSVSLVRLCKLIFMLSLEPDSMRRRVFALRQRHYLRSLMRMRATEYVGVFEAVGKIRRSST